MASSATTGLAVLLAGAAAVAAAQEPPERTFVATARDCDHLTWARRTLKLYPNIASACREVVARDGQYFARLEGEVLRVSGNGNQVTLRLAGGDLMTMTPPRTLSVYVNGRRTTARELRPGDRFDFYIPQDSFAVAFYVEDRGLVPVLAPVIYEQAPDTQDTQDTE